MRFKTLSICYKTSVFVYIFSFRSDNLEEGGSVIVCLSQTAGGQQTVQMMRKNSTKGWQQRSEEVLSFKGMARDLKKKKTYCRYWHLRSFATAMNQDVFIPGNQWFLLSVTVFFLWLKTRLYYTKHYCKYAGERSNTKFPPSSNIVLRSPCMSF